ncbi:MAG TPA: BON domain-containing protein [Casimicrobiaceae bacterium]|nr:BON domain-containing protein [Casimicrobiaceae bacterium]
MAEPGIDSLQINVDTSSGRVTLTGEVDNENNRTRAKELASSIEGVTGVVDRLTLKRS